MKTRYKIIIGCGLAVLVFAGLFTAILSYYYKHPSKVISFAEEWVSGTYGVSLTIQKMSYSRNPFKIRLEGVHAGPGPEIKGFSLDIPLIEAEISIEGRWGRRTLVLSNVRVSGFTSRLSENPDLSGLRVTTGEPSSNAGLMRKLFLYLAFRNLRLQSAEVRGGPVSALLGERSLRADHIHASLQIDRPVEFTCDVQAEWPSRGMKLLAPQVFLKADKEVSLEDPEVGGTLMVKGAYFESPMTSIRDLRMKTALLYHIQQKKLFFSKTEVVPGLVIYKKGVLKKDPLSGLRVATKGEFDLGKEVLRADPLHITLGEGQRFEGSLDVAFGKQKELGLKILKTTLFPDRLLSLLSPEIELPPVRVTGPIRVTGTIEGSQMEKGGKVWNWKSDLYTIFQQNHLSFVSSSLNGNGNITGEVRAKGTFPDIRISGAVKASDILLTGTGLDLKPFEASLAFSGSHPSYAVRNLSVHIPELKRVFREKEFLVQNLILKAENGKVDATKRTLYLPTVRIDSSLMKKLKASLKVNRSQIMVKLKGRDTGLLEAAKALDLLPSGWKASGLDDVEIEARAGKVNGYFLSGRVALEQFSFQNREETCVGESLAVKADIKGKIGGSFSKIEAHVNIGAEKGEILYDRFYFDLQKNPFALSGEGLYYMRNKKYRLAGLRLGLKSILQLHLKGEMEESGEARSFGVSVKIPDTPLGPAFKTLLREPFQTEKPILTAIDAAGRLSGEFRLNGTESKWAAKGHLRWKKGAVSIAGEKVSLEGIDLSLPVWYRNHNKKDSMKPLSGKLSVRNIKTSFLPDQNLNLNLLAGPNTFSVPSPTIITLPGGEVRIGPLITKGWADMRPSCDTSMIVDSLRLEPLLARFSKQNIRGTLKGNLNSIHIERGAMRSKGQMEARLFGGSVLLSNIGASQLFSSTPVFQLHALWHDLDLAKMTTGTGFGKIQGVLKGHVKRLEIAEGQPQRFDLLLETIKKKGVPQRISVKAVDHIAELGGGQSPFVGAAGIFASFFKEFPYQKIGIHASLENDVFRINGTIREDGKEYLVKRGFISGVNVINQNPDNRVSFKDMIKRLKRVATSKSGPVVK